MCDKCTKEKSDPVQWLALPDGNLVRLDSIACVRVERGIDPRAPTGRVLVYCSGEQGAVACGVITCASYAQAWSLYASVLQMIRKASGTVLDIPMPDDPASNKALAHA